MWTLIRVKVGVICFTRIRYLSFWMAMKMRLGVTKRGLFSSWLVISLIWVAVVGYRAWRDIPRDDWFTEPSTNQLSDVVNLLLYNPIARAVALDSIVLALAPPILALACGLAIIWTVREAQRQPR